MNLFITLLENVNKSRTSANNVSLNVQLRMLNKFVYGETGRYPFFMNSALRCIRYWLKFLTLDRSRLSRQAYEMLKNLDERGKMCWATRIKNFLFSIYIKGWDVRKPLFHFLDKE
jgi:hypothetical protein